MASGKKQKACRMVANIPVALCMGLSLVLVMAHPSLSAFTPTNQNVKARLTGFQQTPSVLTDGSGTFTAQINVNSTLITYNLTYANMSSAVTAAHIHFGQWGVDGEKMAFLCGGGDKPACPASGTVTGQITAADILAIPAQGLAAADFDGAVRAIETGHAFVNVHTTNFPPGEIRGQIEVQAMPIVPPPVR